MFLEYWTISSLQNHFLQEGEFFCNVERKQLDNSVQVEDLIEKQVN